MKVKLVSITQPTIEGINSPEELIVYCARVSNPSNQMNMESAPKLIKYLIKNKHWSPFEMVNVCFEIVTSRAIAAQILRHRSFSFQEFSQRYAQALSVEPIELRKQALSNRQSSTDIISDESINQKIEDHINDSLLLYNELIDNGVAKETARMVLPLTTQTTMYMNGSLRSWIHYLDVRAHEHTQKEHRDIAYDIKSVLALEFPNVFEALL